MTDVEMTTLCAEAMGLKHQAGHIDAPCDSVMYWEAPAPTSSHSGYWTRYHPLFFDAQAMALVKKLKLTIEYKEGLWWANEYLHTEGHRYIFSRSSELNRAIVECAAKITRTR